MGRERVVYKSGCAAKKKIEYPHRALKEHFWATRLAFVFSRKQVMQIAQVAIGEYVAGRS